MARALYLYHISQTERRGYDTYSDAVVAAENEDAASRIHPRGDTNAWNDYCDTTTWASTPGRVVVKLIGKAAVGISAGVICASFHAG